MQESSHARRFEVGDRIRYIGRRSIEAPAGIGDDGPDTLLREGMVGTVVQDEDEWVDLAPATLMKQKAICRVRFDNGYEYTVFENRATEFELVKAVITSR